MLDDFANGKSKRLKKLNKQRNTIEAANAVAINEETNQLDNYIYPTTYEEAINSIHSVYFKISMKY